VQLLKQLILPSLLLCAYYGHSQCVPVQPQNLQVSVNNFTGNVTVEWRVPCPSSCNNSANTSVLYFIGFYSQQSAAPNALDGEYGFTTFVAVGCPYTELWDGFYRDSTSTAEPKESECISILMGQEVNPFSPGFEASFSKQEICNNNYGYGAGIMRQSFPGYVFCSGVTYDVKVWEIEVNVPPNGSVTSQSIACNDLYLDESAPVVQTSAFTYPGFISTIASPVITISSSESSDGVYSGVDNRIIIDCTDTFSFEYNVTPGCNFTESVAAYFNISQTYTYATGIYNPWDWGLGVDDWYIFFANNIVNGSTGQPVPYIGTNYFQSFTVSDDMEVCILTQDPCNGSSGKTCIQFEAVDLDTVIADFGYNIVWSNQCDSFEVEFINNTTGAITYYWDFGDGGFSTDTNLTHLFVGGGPFEVELAAIHTGWCGNNDTVTQTLSFSPVIDTAQAVISYTSTYSTSCDSLVAQFTTQTISNGSLLWDFGNGTTSTALNPTVIYTQPGTYDVSLVVIPTSVCLLPDTFHETVTFNPITNNAVADFSYNLIWSNDCDSFMIEFTNLSTGTSDYYWEFGDNTFSSDTNLTHVFTSGGPFTVVLTAYYGGTCGINDSTVQTLNFTPLIDKLEAAFSYTSAYSPNCDSLLVQFTGSSSGAATYLWDFGNGTTVSTPNGSAVYFIPGDYNVSLIITPTANCTIGDTAAQLVNFTPLAYNSIADFTYNILSSNACDTFVVEFTNHSTGGTSYFWDFGNGTTSTDTNAIITYAAGTYDVQLQVNDSRSCSSNDTTMQQLLFTPVFDTLLADFDYTIVPNCDVVELTFTNLSTGINQFLWQVNNAIVSNEFSPNSTLLYFDADTLSVSLTARATNNCITGDTASKIISLPAPYGYPVADFTFTPTEPDEDEVVRFTDASLRAHPDSYWWDFGDGASSSEKNPQHIYSELGAYTICLSVANEYSCPDSACKQLLIVSDDLVDLPTAFTPNGDDHNDIFIVRGKDIEKIDLKIFNRWGELVFQSKNPYFGWDGTYKGEPQEMEVYDWLLNATLKSGTGVFKKGNVTLLR